MKESRKYSIGEDNISQVMKFGLYGNFEDMAGETGDVWRTNDDHEVMEFIYATFPWTREFPASGGGIIYLFLTEGEVEQVGPDYWVATLTYDIPDFTSNSNSQVNNNLYELGYAPDAGENNGQGWTDEYTQLSFNTISQLGHINTSRQVVEIQKSGDLPAGIDIPLNVLGRPAPIGENGDTIEGTEVHKREFSFQITKYFSYDQLKYKYMRKLYRLSTGLNNKTFFGFPAGTTLFVGASGNRHPINNTPVTFEFMVRNNFKFIQAADSILSDPDQDDPAVMFDQLADPGFPASTGGMDKLGLPGIHSGWSTVDYRYLQTPDQTAKTLIMRPIFRLIHLNHEFVNFDLLKI